MRLGVVICLAGAQTPSFTRPARLVCCLGRTPRSIGTVGQSHLRQSKKQAIAQSAIVRVSHSRRQRQTKLMLVYFIMDSFFVAAGDDESVIAQQLHDFEMTRR